MTDKYLELMLRVLLLQYGRERILLALAALENSSVDQLEQRMGQITETRKATPRTKRPSASVIELAEAAGRERPEISEPIRVLALAFQNRTFLPSLREVQQFLNEIHQKPVKVKSRQASAPKLIHALARLSRDELVRLNAEGRAGGESDFSVLARAIMRSSPRE